MILALIRTHFRLCVYSRASQTSFYCTTHTTLPTMEIRAGTALRPPPSGAGMRSSLFSSIQKRSMTCRSHSQRHSHKTQKQSKREKGEGSVRGESYKNWQIWALVCSRSGSVCLYMCVRMHSVLKEKVLLHQQGPPATRVRALLGWRPGTDLRVCLKCRLQILCTKSLQEYPWPLESLSGFSSGPAIAAHPSLKYSGLAGDGTRNQTLRHRINMTSYSLSRSGSDSPPFKLCVGVPVLSTCHLVCVHTRGLDSEQKCQQQESEVALGSRNAPHSHKGDSSMEVRVFTCTAHTQRPYLKDSTLRHHNQAQGHICVSHLVWE